MFEVDLTDYDIENDNQAKQLNEYSAQEDKKMLLEQKREEYRRERLQNKIRQYHNDYKKTWLSNIKGRAG